jgi:hypothetical protein
LSTTKRNPAVAGEPALRVLLDATEFIDSGNAIEDPEFIGLAMRRTVKYYAYYLFIYIYI